MVNLDNLLKELKVILPDVSVSDINLTELMKFDMHNLQEQYQTDLIYISFFSMLKIEIGHLLKKKEDELQDLGNDLAPTFLGAAGKVKQQIESDPRWRKRRDEITQIEYQHNAVSTIVANLERKGITLNVLTAKARAELGAGISH